MLILSTILLLLSNSAQLRKDLSIFYSRTTITILIITSTIGFSNLNWSLLDKGLGIFGGLFHTTCTTTVFQLFILVVSSVILIFTAFLPRKIWVKKNSTITSVLSSKLLYYPAIIFNKIGQQFSIIEYPLLILFIILGAVFLVSASDLVSIFLAIELQSYGLYLLSTVFRDSEPATSGGLMYFLLGGLSSCFILLSTALLYANSGTTSLDSLYIISSIYNVSGEHLASLLYWYRSYYIHISLVFMAVGFLFKVSAAPFHFWSPDVYDSIPTVVTTFVAIIAKISIFIFLLEIVHYTNKPMLDSGFSWTTCLLFSSLLSLIIGTVVGLTQSRIKRLYAFSTISHVGFILLGLSIHTVESTQAFFFYLLQYSISNLNAFMVIIAIGYSLYCYIYKGTYRLFDKSRPGHKKMFIFDFHLLIKLLEKHVKRQVRVNSPKKGVNLEESRAGSSEKSEVNLEESLRAVNTKRVVENFENSQRTGNASDLPIDKTGAPDVSGPVNPGTAGSSASVSGNANENLNDENNSPVQLIGQLKGYYYINPVLAMSLAITLFSFAGIPPLIGFFGKQMILSAAIDGGYIFMSFVAILTSVISAVYYLAIIKQIFFDQPDYVLNPELNSLNFNQDVLITEKNLESEKVNIKINNVVLSSSLSLSISIITLIISLFIFIPEELLNLANLLALILFNI